MVMMVRKMGVAAAIVLHLWFWFIVHFSKTLNRYISYYAKASRSAVSLFCKPSLRELTHPTKLVSFLSFSKAPLYYLVQLQAASDKVPESDASRTKR